MKPISCIDIGANLTHKSFRRDLGVVIDSARAAGVEQMIVTGTSPKSSHQAVTLAAEHPQVLRATAGIHPHEAREFNRETGAMLEQLAGKEAVVAIGECGLDFNRDFSPRAQQRECFESQLELAARLGMPIFLHERDAHQEFLKIMRQHRANIPKGVVHCFTGTKEELHAYLDLDLHIGITGWICDERRGRHLRDLVRKIPVDRLMIETDAPFLAPRDLTEKIRRNEPKFLPHILRTVAECRGQSAESLAEGLLETTRSFFGL